MRRHFLSRETLRAGIRRWSSSTQPMWMFKLVRRFESTVLAAVMRMFLRSAMNRRKYSSCTVFFPSSSSRIRLLSADRAVPSTFRVSRKDLENFREANVTALVFLHVSFAVRFLAIVSLVLCILPLIGFMLSFITVLSTRKVHGWPRTLGFIALAVSCPIAFLVVIAMLLGF